jgi:hypothetical protein
MGAPPLLTINPARRNALTRKELALRLGAVVLALLLLPFALAFGSTTYANASARAESQAHSVRPVTATVVETPAGAPTTTRIVRWQLPNGATRTTRITVDRGSTQPGDQVHIWLDAAGHPTDPPESEAGAVVLGAGAALLAWLLGVLVIATLHHLALRNLRRRQSAAWQREWELVEPIWSREFA